MAVGNTRQKTFIEQMAHSIQFDKTERVKIVKNKFIIRLRKIFSMIGKAFCRCFTLNFFNHLYKTYGAQNSWSGTILLKIICFANADRLNRELCKTHSDGKNLCEVDFAAKFYVVSPAERSAKR